MKRLLVTVLTILLAGAAWADEYEARGIFKLAHYETLDATTAAREGDEEKSLEHWKRALELTEEAYSVRDGFSDAFHLPQLAERAFQAQEFDKAERYAKSALETAAAHKGPAVGSIGEAIHHGHLVLGMLALRDNDVESAGERLLEAGKTPGSPSLGSFGPNMTLARQLLERGEREIVLDYFELCRSFWDSGVEQGKLDRWSLVVRNGGIPDFGANLVYGF